MHILIDKYVPFLEGVLDQYAIVEFLEPEEFTPARVKDADALIIRTRTHCDAGLLEGSNVRFIATATIGYDHIDTLYCEHKGIYWTNCPGCNAQAVCDYVEEALTTAKTTKKGQTLIGSFGVVGVGHVGSKVAEMAKRQGWRVLLNDPPKGIGVSLDEIAQECDVITFHTPLDKTTYHLCSATFLQKCKPNALIINAARGGIVDEKALLESGHPYVIDCWENEPNITPKVCQNDKAILVSFHIAGYSWEGKKNASIICLDAFCRFFGLPVLSIQKNFVPLHGFSGQGWLKQVSDTLKAHPEDFEKLRKQYILR